MLVVVSLVFLGLHIKMHCSHSKHNCVFFLADISQSGRRPVNI